mmetsp:Transcript_42413/g.70527  ORF Transcript_42413/g.70527 Transcript_42413/m.70527 type:complete len:339 (+) Transcript_42413:63-1079(+)|eukprot:CAMPEP_0119338408 /NCGR_PEP_ID=MMETSP1333-20130426/95950_1 /TAXON_ID=418940 /ORGANISM="Scyphosphaera apsteinii, Strain RCC1455" /LENGTH=338 /DNA_ID=CAMNT_0007349667 /DNA_START=54 /DNA_END=1070 /DNA_ORIENTATION=+
MIFRVVLIASAVAAQLPQECMGFIGLNFDIFAFDRYSAFFRNSSKMTLLQAGSYYGADGIEEYVRFAFLSPYLVAANLDSLSSLKAFDGTTCIFRYLRVTRQTFTQPAVAGAVIDVATYLNIYYAPAENYITNIQVAYKQPYLETFFGLMTNTDGVTNFICKTMQNNCSATWEKQEIQSIEGCKARIDALPVTEGPLAMVDGKSRGCRVLHSAFASTNDFHCPHISYEPEEDDGGQVKCQVSKPGLDLSLDDVDRAVYDAYLASQNISVAQGFTLLPTLQCYANSDCPVGLICGDASPDLALAAGRRAMLFGSQVSAPPPPLPSPFSPSLKRGACVTP